MYNPFDQLETELNSQNYVHPSKESVAKDEDSLFDSNRLFGGGGENRNASKQQKYCEAIIKV